ncbi:PAPA-1-like conserved region-domain-containing protein [Lipomyces arxii]|uniref:PAPA-1-like conserved region-domain-containing protein n=1 Tax=Lipomyces arxii TaxID=56418 RepID=UPI0034CEAE7F
MREEEDEEEEDELDYNATDYSRLTERQRARLLDDTTELQELSNEPFRKKIFTEEELMLRRTETARRRKNLSEKRREEEKMDTINKLLKKQASKRKGKLKSIVGLPGTPAIEDETAVGKQPTESLPVPNMYRWVSKADGIVLGVPKNFV